MLIKETMNVKIIEVIDDYDESSMGKECNKCNLYKSYTDFNKNVQSIDGYRNECRDCQNNAKKLPITVVRKMYNSMVANSKKRKHEPPQFSLELFNKWVYENGFAELYSNWQDNDYIKNLTPSVDRLINADSYTFINIRLVTWVENKEAYEKDRRNGVNSHLPKVDVYFISRHKVVTYNSATIAAKAISADRSSFSKVLKTGGIIKDCLIKYTSNNKSFNSMRKNFNSQQHVRFNNLYIHTYNERIKNS